MDIAKRIAILRKEKGWSQNKLAKTAGVGQSTINEVEKKTKRPSMDTLEAICKALNMSLSEFFSDNNNDLYLPPDIAKFSIDKENHNLIRIIHNMKDAGYNNEAIESWLKSMYLSVDDLIQKHGGIQGKPQGKVVFAYDASPEEEEEIRKKIADPNFKLPFKE